MKFRNLKEFNTKSKTNKKYNLNSRKSRQRNSFIELIYPIIQMDTRNFK